MRRILKNSLDALFSIKNYSIPDSIEDLRGLGSRSPHLTVKNRQLHLLPPAQEALRKSAELIMDRYELKETATFGEVCKIVGAHVQMWLKEGLEPNANEFLDRLQIELSEFRKARRFVYRVEGLDFADIDTITLAGMTLHRLFSRDLLEGVEVGEDTERVVEREFSGRCVIEGREIGSPEKARSKFVFDAEMILSVLGLCGCLLKGAVMTKICPRLAPVSDFESLSWVEGEPGLSFTWHRGKEQPFTLSNDIVQYWTDECFLKEMLQCLQKGEKTDLENAIVRSIYWFREAHKDRNDTMKFIKLWSSVEAFFSIGDEKITETNAACSSVVMVCGGYSVVEPQDYRAFRQRVKKLYTFRCKAVHHGYYDHVPSAGVEDFAQHVAWLIVNMVSFTVRGYINRREVIQECMRIDKCLSDGQSDLSQNKSKGRKDSSSHQSDAK